DRGAGREQESASTGLTTLTEDEVLRMTKEAEQYAAEDQERKEAGEARNKADSLRYQGRKTLNDPRHKAPDDQVEPVEARARAVGRALQGSDAEGGQQAAERLQQALMDLGAAVYAQAEAAGASAGPGGAGAGAAGSGGAGAGSGPAGG